MSYFITPCLELQDALLHEIAVVAAKLAAKLLGAHPMVIVFMETPRNSTLRRELPIARCNKRTLPLCV